jgi:hypothetical protein
MPPSSYKGQVVVVGLDLPPQLEFDGENDGIAEVKRAGDHPGVHIVGIVIVPWYWIDSIGSPIGRPRRPVALMVFIIVVIPFAVVAIPA